LPTLDYCSEKNKKATTKAASIHAGRVMLERLKQLADEKKDFAFETTLASKTFAHWLQGLKAEGYAFHLFYLWLPSPDFAIARVAERVRMGGHNVPDDTVRRRYHAGLKNFFQMYRSIADSWYLFDNSTASPPMLIASKDKVSGQTVENSVMWLKIVEEYDARTV
jgi:predicted ABC-type ATPase